MVLANLIPSHQRVLLASQESVRQHILRRLRFVQEVLTFRDAQQQSWRRVLIEQLLTKWWQGLVDMRNASKPLKQLSQSNSRLFQHFNVLVVTR